MPECKTSGFNKFYCIDILKKIVVHACDHPAVSAPSTCLILHVLSIWEFIILESKSYATFCHMPLFWHFMYVIRCSMISSWTYCIAYFLVCLIRYVIWVFGPCNLWHEILLHHLSMHRAISLKHVYMSINNYERFQCLSMALSEFLFLFKVQSQTDWLQFHLAMQCLTDLTSLFLLSC